MRRLPMGVRVLAVTALVMLAVATTLHLAATHPDATHAPAVITVQVQTSPSCRLPQMPRWLQAPATTQVEVLSPYGVGQTITYRSSSGAGLTVWQQHNWTLGLWTSIGPSALSAESVFAPLRLPGRGRLLWPQGEPLRMAWCTRRGNYTVSVAGLPPAAPLAAAVIQAWSDAPARVYRCRTAAQAVVCAPAR